MGKELTIGISEQTFRQAEQLEDLLRKSEELDRVVQTRGDNLTVMWRSTPYNNPLQQEETHHIAINSNLVNGLRKAAFGRYLDLVEGQEQELANDIVEQHQPEGCLTSASVNRSGRK